MKYLQNKKGQGMMEYILIAAFAVGLAVYLFQHTKGPVQKNIDGLTSDINAAGHP